MDNLSHEIRNTRIAWVSPSMKLGFYVQPVLRNLRELLPETTVFTADWPGFIKGCENTFYVNIVGKNREFVLRKTNTGYNRIIQILSLNIIPSLYKFQPKVVFVVGFSLWSFITVFLKFIGWKAVIIYDGSSPNIDVTDSWLRLVSRKIITYFADAFVTNSLAGKAYLVKVLKAEASIVFAQPYQVPDKQSLLTISETNISHRLNSQQPTFLFIGQTIHRKGITFLLKACLLLKQQGCTEYKVIVIGDGEQRQEYENWSKSHGLENQVQFEGWVSYEKLGGYFQNTDVFIFPTLEDIWGMAVLEAMLFSKPILCSKFAGVAEIILPEENGYLFDPYDSKEIAHFMRHLIDNPDLINSMGAKSQEIIAKHTPQTAAELLAEVTSFVLDNRQVTKSSTFLHGS